MCSPGKRFFQCLEQVERSVSRQVEAALRAVGEEAGWRFEVERAFQERYFTLSREELKKRFELGNTDAK